MKIMIILHLILESSHKLYHLVSFHQLNSFPNTCTVCGGALQNLRWRVNSGVFTVDRCNIQWRTWAARFIRAAWRRYSKRKIMELHRKEEEEAEGSDGYRTSSGGGSYSLGASFLASKFAANALRGIHRN
ncbi:hypothetical protein E1A91_D05G058500v1 [Gossypium mustelinum]|uniref:Uncharacterized protein n=2 Tax=Gossypium TaxID=3633 RepID=A0A5J5RA06_GOSBA|nr:hypothetical protein ES319_D05G055100v1 [Gossypium barbadense]TYI79960.1 hypothetical protein E1A91_D05G058500v1 [Gossypium mustelinum]